MNPRALAAMSLGLAAFVHLFVAAPAREAERAANGDLTRLRSELTEARRRLEVLDKGADVIARAGLIEVEGGSRGSAEAVQKVRAGVVKALQQAKVRRVRLEVRAGAEPTLAGVSISAQGSFFTLVRLAALLTGPGSGLVVQRVTLGGADTLAISFDAVALGRTL